MVKDLIKLAEQHLHIQSHKRSMKHPKLTDLFWETTLRCNAHCQHCGSNASPSERYDELRTHEILDTFAHIAENMDASKIFVHVTGGEPTLRKDVFHVMKVASDTYGFRWGMTSNGMLWNESMIQQAKDANMSSISISIDGMKETHDIFRGVLGSYQAVLENVRLLRDASFVKHLQVITVLHKHNIHELDEMYEVMSGLGLHSWRLTSVDPIGRANQNSHLMLDGNEHRLLLDFIKTKRKTSVLPLLYGCSSYLGFDYEREVRGHYFKCRTGVSIASILHNGYISVCPNAPRDPSYIQGNVRFDSFVDVWNQRFSMFRRADRTISDACESCEDVIHCLGGSFHTWDPVGKVQNKCVRRLICDT